MHLSFVERTTILLMMSGDSGYRARHRRPPPIQRPATSMTMRRMIRPVTASRPLRSAISSTSGHFLASPATTQARRRPIWGLARR